jgi:radical SAM superfamily enzyme YgiQ (UPF0313 family)
MKIALINPPSQDIKNSVKDLLYGCWCQGKRIGGGTFPPLNLLSIGTLLEKDNIVKILDAHALKLEYNDLIKYLANFEAILFPTTSFCYLEDVEFLKNIKKINKDLISIVFGTYPTFFPEKSLNSEYIDIGVIGEPEFTIKEVINHLKSNNSLLKTTKGVCYKEDGKIIKNRKGPYIENLDELPIPNREYIKKFYYFNPLVKNKEWTTALTSRGCPASCNFCLSPEFYGNKYRYQSPSRMIKEVEYLLNSGYKEIFYRDETFTGNKKRVEKFCNSIISKKMKLDGICNIRIGTVNRELLKLMKLSGCHYIKIGVESGSQKVLDNLKKGINISDIVKTFKWANELNIKTHAHMILGGPGETELTLKKTNSFIKRINPSTVTFNLFTPFPGSKIYRESVSQLQDSIEDIELTFQQSLLKPFLNKYYTHLDYKYLERLIPIAYRKFYFRSKYILSQLKEIQSIFSLKRIFKSSLNVISFIFKNEELEVKE